MQHFPKVTFVVPVLNAGDDLANCLASITRQDYPEGQIEIIVADSGTDSDIGIAVAGFRVTIVRALEGSADTGIDVGIAQAKGEIVFVVAATSGLPRIDWIRQMVKPFAEQETVAGVFTQFAAAPTDNSITRYFCAIHAEPFTWFVFGDASNPRYFKHVYEATVSGKGYTVYRFAERNPPCIAVAHGLGFRKSFASRPSFRFQDMLPMIRMIEAGEAAAYVEDAGIYHRHFQGFLDFIKEYRRQLSEARAAEAPGAPGLHGRLSFWRRMRARLFWLYGFTMVLPLLDGVSMAIFGKDRCMLWHGPVTIVSTWLRLQSRRGRTSRP